ncbi:MAG: hypothetical protein ACLQI7_13935 [Streptosporangiaceae bacterium]|jgi:hypothetical protein
MPEQIHGASLDVAGAGELAGMLAFFGTGSPVPTAACWPPPCAALLGGDGERLVTGDQQ